MGRLADGHQFFLTTPFVPAVGNDPGREFVALYIFDRGGRLAEARMDDLGPRARFDEEKARDVFDGRLRELGPVKFERIEIEPFQIERYGIVFGLVPRKPDEDEAWWIEVQPGNYMVFQEPWDSGEYDT